MSRKLTNNARTSLSAALTASATSATVGAGSPFPSLMAGDWFPISIGAGHDVEICRCIARSGTTLTIERGAEGTTPRSWPAGTLLELRLTAGSLTNPGD